MKAKLDVPLSPLLILFYVQSFSLTVEAGYAHDLLLLAYRTSSVIGLEQAAV